MFLAFVVARTVGLGAIGAGLLPIALGYLIAHYLTYLLIDGQWIVAAIGDPFQQGWNLFGLAFFTPSGDVAATRAWCGRSSWRRSSAGTCWGRGVGTSSPSRRHRPGWRPSPSAVARSRWRS